MALRWHVQRQGEDGLFHTVVDGTHEHLSTAYWHYANIADLGVALLLRGSHIVLRSDTAELVDRPDDALL